MRWVCWWEKELLGGGVGWGWVLNCCVILEKYRGMNGNDGFDFGCKKLCKVYQNECAKNHFLTGNFVNSNPGLESESLVC